MQMKKLSCLLLTGCLAFSLAACGGNKDANDTATSSTVVNPIETEGTTPTQAASGKYVVPAETDFTVEDVDGGVKITKYTGTETSIEIPAQIGGKDVVSIGSNAFAKARIVGVKLPDTVITVEKRAFFFCTSLVELSLGANVEVLEKESVNGCTALTTIHLNGKLREIGEAVFGMTTSLKEIQLPSSLEKIAGGAFVMGGLERITIPGSVQEIGKQAFTSCNSLTEVVIEDGVKEIASTAFEYCEALIKAELPASLEEIGWAAFQGCKNVVIYGEAGSKAESYAAENELTFKTK